MATPPAHKILIIDDDASLCEVLGMGLSHAGFQVQGSTNLDEAKAKILSYHPDLIVLDLLIPGTGGGFEMLKYLADQGLQKIPVIIITGHYDHDLEIEKKIRKEPSVVDFLKKPFNSVDLAARIRTELQASSAKKRSVWSRHV